VSWIIFINKRLQVRGFIDPCINNVPIAQLAAHKWKPRTFLLRACARIGGSPRL